MVRVSRSKWPITEQLLEILAKEPEWRGLPLDQIAFNLSDTYKACGDIVRSLDDILAHGKTSRRVRKANMERVYGELCIHLPYHLKRLQKPLLAMAETQENVTVATRAKRPSREGSHGRKSPRMRG